MRQNWNLMPPGSLPSRFVAIVAPSADTSIVWSIDDNPALKAAGKAYLDDVRRVFEDPERLDTVLATRIAQYASMESPTPNLVYLAILALTDLYDGRSVVLELGDGALRLSPLSARDHAEALAEFEAMASGGPGAPGP